MSLKIIIVHSLFYTNIGKNRNEVILYLSIFKIIYIRVKRCPTQLVANASFTYFCSVPPMWGEERKSFVPDILVGLIIIVCVLKISYSNQNLFFFLQIKILQ